MYLEDFMSLKQEIFKGTVILTIAGLITKVLGLYNKVFLANLISAAEMGRYQLIFPVFLVCHSICCSGIELALSKMVAALASGQCHGSLRRVVKIAVFLSFSLTIVLSMGIFIFSKEISIYFLNEPSCAQYLRTLAFVMPFSSVHTCVTGYFLGIKKAGVPAVAQLIEQITRVLSIYALSIAYFHGNNANASMAVYGMLAGEVVACVFVLIAYHFHVLSEKRRLGQSAHTHKPIKRRSLLMELVELAWPLSTNRVIINGLTSVEAVLIPYMLTCYYGNSEQSLGVFGVLTGMALPFIMFPTTLTNSLATMLLPAVSEAKEKSDYQLIKRTVSKSLHYCLLTAIISITVFLLYGNAFGNVIFKSEMAGQFLTLFALLCPFMYVTSTLSNVLTGMGKARLPLIHNIISMAIRIAFIVIFIPRYGIKGYLWGLLVSYLMLVALHGIQIMHLTGIEFNVYKSIIWPGVFAALGGVISMLIYQNIINYISLSPIFLLAISCIVICFIYFMCLLHTKLLR